MKRQKVVPVDDAREFHLQELFFSATTGKGIITYGNQVFVRVSNYRIEELIGSPHSIVRHPDMPKAVFKLFWDYLLAGKPVAAYVKNMASDGRYYWVVAVAAPVADGSFLSVRFKPSSPLFRTVEGVYKTLLAEEQACGQRGEDGKAAMQAAHELLLHTLQEKGFADYDAFMRTMVYAELSSRDELLSKDQSTHRNVLSTLDVGLDGGARALRQIYEKARVRYAQINGIYAQLDRYARLNDQLRKQADTILDLTHEFRLTCMNLTVTSSRVGEEGRTLSVIAMQLGDASSLVAKVVSSLTSQVEKVSQCLGATIFALAWARLQFEVVMQYYREIATIPHEADHPGQSDPRLQRLGDLHTAFVGAVTQTSQSLHGLAKDLKGLSSNVDDLRKSMLSLHVTYVGGLVEACRSASEAIFRPIFVDIRKHIESTKGELVAFNDAIGILDQLAGQTPHIIGVVSDAAREMEQDHASLLNGAPNGSSQEAA
ncbi:MAG: PAS domain-containing protein [Nitrospiraceae bacterium]